jgi:tetratricopeptide (TPR) repeat protein
MHSRMIFFVSLVLVGAAAYFGVIRPSDDAEKSVLDEPTTLSISKHVQNWMRQPRARAASNASVAAPVASVVSKECRSVWDQLDGLDLQKVLEGSQALPAVRSLAKHCAGLPREFGVPAQFVDKACGNNPETAKITPEQKRHDCYQALVLYRAMTADYNSGDLSADKITDRRLLSDKLIAGLMKDPAVALPYAERLLELEPNFAPAAKMAAVLNMATLQAGASPDKALAAIERSERLESDPSMHAQLTNTVKMASTVDGPERVETAKKLAQEQMGTPPGDYLSSYVAFKEARYDEAQKLLSAAIAADPGNRDYQETQKDLSKLLRDRVANPNTKPIYSNSFSADPTKLIP